MISLGGIWIRGRAMQQWKRDKLVKGRVQELDKWGKAGNRRDGFLVCVLLVKEVAHTIAQSGIQCKVWTPSTWWLQMSVCAKSMEIMAAAQAGAGSRTSCCPQPGQHWAYGSRQNGKEWSMTVAGSPTRICKSPTLPAWAWLGVRLLFQQLGI